MKDVAFPPGYTIPMPGFIFGGLDFPQRLNLNITSVFSNNKLENTFETGYLLNFFSFDHGSLISSRSYLYESGVEIQILFFREILYLQNSIVPRKTFIQFVFDVLGGIVGIFGVFVVSLIFLEVCFYYILREMCSCGRWIANLCLQQTLISYKEIEFRRLIYTVEQNDENRPTARFYYIEFILKVIYCNFPYILDSSKVKEILQSDESEFIYQENCL